MADPIRLALIVLFLPLAAALLAAVMNTARLRSLAHWPLVAAGMAAAALAVMLIGKVAEAHAVGHVFLSTPLTWFAAGHLSVNFTILLDPLAVTMLGTITFISTLIAIFSSGYMEGDRGYARYFAVMGLFVFSMCGLVMANNLLLLVAFWEGVGLCSYLLVGYYFAKPSAAAAARKAFLVTRLGDTGMLIGIFLLWRLGGYHTDISVLFNHIAKHPPDPTSLTVALLCLFCGAVGKSAQFPLYVWLPDAMEGPTPVSALIHAATMVTAGVYLVARCAPLFALAPDAQVVIAWTGGITALLAAFFGLAQTDLKRVLAYSTVSQLGYMFLALGCLGSIAPTVAVTAAIFHLFTHAFFKALLFLGSGSVMHSMGGVIDLRKFGGLRKLMPMTHATFLCGAAALAGVPLLSGFWSKDAILEALHLASEGAGAHHQSFLFLLIIGLTAAFMTAFYTFRAYFLTFWGPERIPEEAGHHAHESPEIMTVPLMVLAVGAVFVGAFVGPLTHWFPEFLSRTPSLRLADHLAGAEHGAGHHAFNWGLAGVSTLLALGGVACAWWLYGQGGADKTPPGMEPVFLLSRDKLYVDEIYHTAIVIPAERTAWLARVFDGVLDGFVRIAAAIPALLGGLVRPVQNGLVQFYALSMVLGVGVFLTFVVYRIAR